MLMLQGPAPPAVNSHVRLKGSTLPGQTPEGANKHSHTSHVFHGPPGEGWQVSSTGLAGLRATSGALRRGGGKGSGGAGLV